MIWEILLLVGVVAGFTTIFGVLIWMIHEITY